MRRPVVILILFFCLSVGGAYVLVPTYLDHTKTREELHGLHARIAQQENRNAELRHEIRMLQTDSYTVEKVAREKFGYAKPNEIIYDFSTPSSR